VASCGAQELSYEDPLGLRGGVFDHYLEEGLAGAADLDGDGTIRLNEIVDYVEMQVREWCRAHLQPGETLQNPAALPAGKVDDLPLAFTPIDAAREALAHLSPPLTPAEQREAGAALTAGPDRDLLAQWLLALHTGPTAVTVDQYRAYRRTLTETADSLSTAIYRRLPPQDAVLAVAHLPAAADTSRWSLVDRIWVDHTTRLARGELPTDAYLDWMGDWLRAQEPAGEQRPGG
jgi:hypothetical protein